MLKKQELLQPNSCLNKAASDELVFVLRAKDLLAPQTLRLWATMAEGTHEPAKIAEARDCATRMEAWRREKFPDTTSAPAPTRAHRADPEKEPRFHPGHD